MMVRQSTRVTDLDKFSYTQVWLPYWTLANPEGSDRPKSAPYTLDETADLLALETEWSRLVLARIKAIGFCFPPYVQHRLVDVVTAAQADQ